MSEKNKMSDLRNELFETLRGLKNKQVTLEDAKGICEVAKVIVESAKVDVSYLKTTDTEGSVEFMEKATERPALPRPRAVSKTLQASLPKGLETGKNLGSPLKGENNGTTDNDHHSQRRA